MVGCGSYEALVGSADVVMLAETETVEFERALRALTEGGIEGVALLRRCLLCLSRRGARARVERVTEALVQAAFEVSRRDAHRGEFAFELALSAFKKAECSGRNADFLPSARGFARAA